MGNMRDKLYKFIYMFEDAFESYVEKKAAWGSLHIVLADGNVDKRSVYFCLDYAQEENDLEAYWLGTLLLQLTRWERRLFYETIGRRWPCVDVYEEFIEEFEKVYPLYEVSRD